MSALTLFLGGDVMTGRGIDQVLPRPSPPRLYEPFVTSALEYVEMAERVHGPIPRAADFAYVWGDALPELAGLQPDARIVNLETSVTTSSDVDPKGINYRMHPSNVPVLTAAQIDCCVLANNHVLDWGPSGLLETVRSVSDAGVRVAGAGRDLAAARAPAAIPLPHGARVLVFAFGGPDCGIPPAWAATARTAGVHRLDDYSARTVDDLARLIDPIKRSRDIVVASIHWGPNWGYEIPAEHRLFAHALIDRARVDVVYGHSSHHPKGIEVHGARLILYGCGDLLNDYEGISDHAPYRSDVGAAYVAHVDAATGASLGLDILPFAIRQFRLRHASPSDRAWLRATLDRECRRFGRGVVARGNRLALA